ncbi:hypothetical protein BATDEDRAFT_26408 [Batrachochytrium dendrobatidis JAM81]|uniref:Uncharacterized protein n=1 Tax=Batrachochytrium dendrobatidis (strain JAM81 / FGSC 10211) TaxID=684364 RepID=F4P7K7_BATDJ|nr:uncharacterized protein BATDEDRAFT_26408 [Batrachochytrium dendrobatidis JAM81]EGF79146.1 hypothetical protein BATDEDRAFT_26408 [Batrachochytrium dendrobatidis JAM81]|eukprot:XP_006680375.1 hypothetical protein BATDEDRAFT_26408 [Batrachochytrium dendrobatidis JAM81]
MYITASIRDNHNELCRIQLDAFWDKHNATIQRLECANEHMIWIKFADTLDQTYLHIRDSLPPSKLVPIRDDATDLDSDISWNRLVDAIQQLVHTRHPKNNRILVTFCRVALYTSDDTTPDEPPNPFDRVLLHSSGNILTATMQPDGSLHTLYRLY